MSFVNAGADLDTPEGDLFPTSPRVIYQHAPLTQVICQLRFPTLLKIEFEPPAAFQERIRDQFPLLERTQPQLPDVPPEIMQMMGMAIAPVKSEYAFRQEDGSAAINLGPEHISLTTTKYSRWERFSALMQVAALI